MGTSTQRMRGSSRFYQTPGGEFPSVTTILQVIGKPALIAWAANTEREHVLECAAKLWDDVPTLPKMSRAAYVTTLQQRLGEQRAHQKKLTEAGDTGKAVHALIEWNLRREFGQEVGPEPKLSDEAARAFSAYERWRSGVKLEPVRIEQVIWSEKHGYAGTLDLYALALDGIPVVLDWKTGKAIYAEALMQIAAYRQALCEMDHADFGECHGLVVRLPKDGETAPEWKLLEPAECDKELAAFLNAKALWEHLEAKRK